jgi:hypothetical protein
VSGPKFIPSIVNESFREACRIAEEEALAELEPPEPDDRPQWIPNYGGYAVPKSTPRSQR